MNVPLNPEQEKLIREKVESGHYRSPDEVIDIALRLLDERDRKLAALRKDVQEGLDQLERGEHTEYTNETLHELFDKVSKRGREWLASQENKPGPTS